MPPFEIRTVPLNLEFRHPSFLANRLGMGGGSGAVATPYFGLCCITGITGNTNTFSDPTTDDWTTSSIQIGNFRKWSGWEKYRDAVLAAGGSSSDIIETNLSPAGPCVTFRGLSAILFLAIFDVVIIIHGCPPKVIERIKAHSTVGTKVRWWMMSDRMPTGPLYSLHAEWYRLRMIDYLLQGTDLNEPAPTSGGTRGTDVDPEQASPWRDVANRAPSDPLWAGNYYRHAHPLPADESPFPGDLSGHSWFQDCRSHAMYDIMAEAMYTDWNDYWSGYPAGAIDGFHSDNCSHQFIAGSATNVPAGLTSADWQSGWHYGIATIHSTLFNLGDRRFLSANIGDHTQAGTFSDLKRQFWEHPFLKGDASGYFTQSELQAGMAAAFDAGCHVYCGGRRLNAADTNPIPQYETADHADLRFMLAYAASRNKQSDFFLTFFTDGDASSTTGGLYHGPTVRPLLVV